MNFDLSRSGLLAAGNFIVDHVKMIDTWPSQDALASIREEESSNGGGPYNLAKDLARLFPDDPEKPFPLAAAGCVGDDADGRWILDDCLAHGIDVGHLHISSDKPTSYTDVMTVQSTGRRTFFHQRGANASVDGAGIDFSQARARIFYLGYLLLLDALDEIGEDGSSGAARLLERARSAGLATVIDLVSDEGGHFREVVAPALPHADVVLTNEFEASRLSGVDLTEFNLETARKAAAAILDMGVGQVVVIHAPGGAAALDSGGAFFASGSVSVPEEEIRGAVGAGDAFAAGFLHEWHEGNEIEACLRSGACVAASCLRHPTASGGILPLNECLALGERWGFREVS